MDGLAGGSQALGSSAVSALLQLEVDAPPPSQPVFDRGGIIGGDGNGVVAIERKSDLVLSLSHIGCFYVTIKANLIVSHRVEAVN
jgi:hypothetical protein